MSQLELSSPVSLGALVQVCSPPVPVSGTEACVCVIAHANGGSRGPRKDRPVLLTVLHYHGPGPCPPRYEGAAPGVTTAGSKE